MLQTQRLLLREPRLTDFDEFWKMINDKIAKRYTGGVTTLTYEERLKLFKKECDEFGKDNNFEFAVIEKINNKYVGYCGYRYCDELKGNELLFGYSKDVWQRGYGFEAAKEVLNFGFKELSFDVVIATVELNNIASIKLLKKLGFEYDGEVEMHDKNIVQKYYINKMT